MEFLSVFGITLLGLGLIAAHIGWMRIGMSFWVPGALAAAPVMLNYGERVHAHPLLSWICALLCVGLAVLSAWIFHQENKPLEAR